MYLQVALPKVDTATPGVWGYVKRLGHALIQECKIEIGGSKIDEQYGDWLNIWYELSHKVGQERGYAKMIGDVPELTNVTNIGIPAYVMYVPFQFWFNRNNGLALPLIALQYHDVRVTVQLAPWEACINWCGTTTPSKPSALQMTNCQLLIDYVYLDSEERKRFAQASHEYLIEQLQFTGSESITSVTNKYRLNFNHPSKYLIWAPHLDLYNSRNTWAVHALVQGSWAAASDQMAKIAALSQCNCDQDGSAGAYQVWVQLPDPSDNGIIASGLFDLCGNLPLGGGAKLDDMAKNVRVSARGYSEENVSNNLRWVVIGQGDTSNNAWSDAFNNCVVVSNNLSSADLSYPVSKTGAGTLLGGATNVPVITDPAQQSTQANVLDSFNYANFVDGTDNPCVNAKVQLNGHDRFQILDGYYFNYVQPYQHFSNTPADGINVYSFALKAEDHQPTDTCNFSRIDNATLQVDLGLNNGYATESALGYANVSSNTTFTANFLGANSSLLNIYTVNYNVLRVMSENKSNALKSSTLIQKTHKNKKKSLVACY